MDKWDKRVCQNSELKSLNQQLKEQYLNARLVSNAPLAILALSQQGWENFARQCGTDECIQRHFEMRMDDLAMITHLNQSLTQHFVAIKKQKVAQPFATIQLQQLDKNRIKIEGLKYNNPNLENNINNNATTHHQRAVYRLRAYASLSQLNQLTDLETKCQFNLVRSEYGLKFSSNDKKCQSFVGYYRLYD